jgi:hypothetical protein
VKPVSLLGSLEFCMGDPEAASWPLLIRQSYIFPPMVLSAY